MNLRTQRNLAIGAAVGAFGYAVSRALRPRPRALGQGLDLAGAPEVDSSGSIYLDWNATTPPAPEVLAAMRGAMNVGWANPSSVHGPGRRALEHIDAARNAVAALAGFPYVIITSGGTEANNLALGHAFATPGGGLVTSRIEHPSVVRTAQALEQQGVVVGWAEVTPDGVVTVAAVEKAIGEVARRGAQVRLVSVQAVNHETGVIHPVPAIADVAHRAGARVHSDIVQAAGKLPRSMWAGADLVSLAAHKLRGPKAIGALAYGPGITVLPLFSGGSQEAGLRPGTQDPGAAAGFAAAATRAADGAARYAQIAGLRDGFEREMIALGAAVNGGGAAARAFHVSNLSFAGWRGADLCRALDALGVSASAGSACSAGLPKPSPVVLEMLGEARGWSATRVSLGEATTADELAEAVARFRRALEAR